MDYTFHSGDLALSAHLAEPIVDTNDAPGLVLCHGFPTRGRESPQSGKSYPELADRMVFEVGLTDSRSPHSLLSEREFSVFERLVRGEGVNEIAQHLSVSSKTVSTHKARLMQKLNLHSVADLVKYAVEHKLI